MKKIQNLYHYISNTTEEDIQRGDQDLAVSTTPPVSLWKQIESRNESIALSICDLEGIVHHQPFQ